MSGTNFSITNQHDLLLAAALAASATSGTYTLTLANDVLLAGVIPLTAPANVTLRIDGNGHALAGSFGLKIAGAGGTVVLNATNLGSYNMPSDYVGYTYGTTSFLGSGTLEIARADAAGLGIVSLDNQSYSPGSSAVLRLDSGAIIGNPIQFGPAAYLGNSSYRHISIDLVGVAAESSFVTVDTGYGLVIPILGGGSVLLQTESPPSTATRSTAFLLTPDGNGGTIVYPTDLPVAMGVTVRGAAGSVLTVPFTDPIGGPIAQPLVDPLNAAVLNADAISFSANPGDALPTVPSGQTLEVIALSVGAYTLPTGQPVALVSTLAGAMSVTGGGADGQLVLAGTGGLTFIAGAGRGTVVAGGGDNAVTIGAGQGSQLVSLAGGNDTVVATGGDDTIAAGSGNNLVRLGSGSALVLSSGNDTIAGGSGMAEIVVKPVSGGSRSLTYLGTGDSHFTGGGAATVVGGMGSDTIRTTQDSTSMVFLNQDSAFVALGGADTLVGGTVDATVVGSGGSLIFAGTGTTYYYPPVTPVGVADTLVGSASGKLSLSNNYLDTSVNILVFAYGQTFVDVDRDFGSTTVISAGPALFINSPYGGGVFLGGAAGGNYLNASTSGSTTVLVAGGNADTLIAGSGPTYIQTGTGAETVVGRAQEYPSTLTLVTFTNGHAADVLFQNFNPRIDYLALPGFGAGEAANALAGATITAGSERISLTDGTHITFENFTGLTLANFL